MYKYILLSKMKRQLLKVASYIANYLINYSYVYTYVVTKFSKLKTKSLSYITVYYYITSDHANDITNSLTNYSYVVTQCTKIIAKVLLVIVYCL